MYDQILNDFLNNRQNAEDGLLYTVMTTYDPDHSTYSPPEALATAYSGGFRYDLLEADQRAANPMKAAELGLLDKTSATIQQLKNQNARSEHVRHLGDR